MLTVQVDHPGSQLTERRDGGRPTVDIGAGPTLGRDDAAEHNLVVTDDEAPVDTGVRRPRPYDGRVRPATDEQLERLDEHRLACPGLPRHGRQARPDDQIEPLDHAEVLDVQLSQHVSGQRSAISEPELGLEDLMEVVRRQSHESGRRCRRTARRDVTCSKRGDELSIDGEAGLPMASDLDGDGL